jgi:purine-binding chemotaxis protein CheW
MSSDPNVNALLDEMTRMRGGGGYGMGGMALQTAGDNMPLRRVLVMHVGSELYGINIENISEISRMTPITFVPGAPTHILGVTSLRGQIVPVINLRMILDVTEDINSRPARKEAGAISKASLQAKPRIVVVHHDEMLAGLLVDAVTEVHDLRSLIEPPLGAPTRGLQIKEGQVMLNDRVLMLLHIPTLFASLTES